MSWFSFLKLGNLQHPTEALHIWISDRHPCPSLGELRAHLLEP
ncbi:hypothetical protein ACFIQG_22160 [Comamonas odontotermitis]